jgi:hypothetical protein
MCIIATQQKAIEAALPSISGSKMQAIGKK